ncbi:hypothetical protein BDZ45DRAFT_744059 [Acephala macrosclerotiorum]|nr:hypothetical protein BDZ45DRAFT_744059 [Acephala macrosclerotiorum]
MSTHDPLHFEGTIVESQIFPTFGCIAYLSLMALILLIIHPILHYALLPTITMFISYILPELQSFGIWLIIISIFVLTCVLKVIRIIMKLKEEEKKLMDVGGETVDGDMEFLLLLLFCSVLIIFGVWGAGFMRGLRGVEFKVQ